MKAFNLYLNAAKDGVNSSVCAVYNILGKCYEEGVGTKQDLKTAVEYYVTAAEVPKGPDYVEAHLNLERCYKNGIGVEIDEEKAFDHCKKAIEGGDIAQVLHFCQLMAKQEGLLQKCYETIGFEEVARRYQKGEGVVEKDEKEAARIYQQIAKDEKTWTPSARCA